MDGRQVEIRWQQRLQQLASELETMQGAARALRERQTELKTRLSHLEQEKQVSSRRRRAIPAIRYSGKDMTSRATNMVSRSFAATNSRPS